MSPPICDEQTSRRGIASKGSDAQPALDLQVQAELAAKLALTHELETVRQVIGGDEVRVRIARLSCTR